MEEKRISPLKATGQRLMQSRLSAKRDSTANSLPEGKDTTQNIPGETNAAEQEEQA